MENKKQNFLNSKNLRRKNKTENKDTDFGSLEVGLDDDAQEYEGSEDDYNRDDNNNDY